MLLIESQYKIARISEHESTADGQGKLINYRVLHLELWQYDQPGMSTILIRNVECTNKEAQQYFDAYNDNKTISLSLNTIEDNISK